MEKVTQNNEESGRKNGFYKNISTLNIEGEFPSKINSKINLELSGIAHSIVSYAPDSFMSPLFNDSTTLKRSYSPERLKELSEEIEYLKQTLNFLQNQLTSKSSEDTFKAEKISVLERFAGKNKKKIKKIKGEIKKHEESIIKMEGRISLLDRNTNSFTKNLGFEKPFNSERKIVPKLKEKSRKKKISSVASSPRVKNIKITHVINSPKTRK